MAEREYKKKKIDMTTGPIMQNVLLFALPIVIGNILQALYTTVDSLVIGHYCGDTQLAAVGTSAQPVEMFLCIFLGIGAGVSILVSQSVGAKNFERITRLCNTSTTFVYCAGITLSILGWLCTPFILKIMSVPDDAYGYALTYTRMVFLGSLGNLGYNMNAGILRGVGDSKASLYILIVSCLTNIVLDITFVAMLGFGVEGVAAATAVAMFFSWFASIVYIRKKYPEFFFKVFMSHMDKYELKAILKIGLPIGLNNSLYALGHMALQKLSNLQGSTFMAGHTVAGRITGISNIAITGMSSAGSAFSGQNFGAKNYKRLREGHLRIPLASGGITLTLGILFILVRKPILGLFSDNPTVLMYASRNVVIILLSQWLYAIFNGIANIVNGTGRVRYTTVINLMMLWVVRIPVAYLINQYFDGTFIMLCFPASFMFGMLCMLAYYAFNKKWRELLAKGEA